MKKDLNEMASRPEELFAEVIRRAVEEASIETCRSMDVTIWPGKSYDTPGSIIEVSHKWLEVETDEGLDYVRFGVDLTEAILSNPILRTFGESSGDDEKEHLLQLVKELRCAASEIEKKILQFKRAD